MERSSFWKILLIAGIVLSLIAFVLGWIGFGVADWQAFQRYNGSTTEFYGLWAYCQDQAGTYGTVCKRWPTAEAQLFNGSRPNFVRTSEGLITTGMILLSLGLFAAIIAMALPILAYLAAGLAFLAFLFLVIGLPIFGRESNNLSRLMGDATYNKRYGFWLIVPTIVLEFLAIFLFLGAALLYKMFGYGNLATGMGGNSVYGGAQRRGPANMIMPPAYGFRAPSPYPPPNYGPMMPNSYPSPVLAGRTESIPQLLSEYLTRHATSTTLLPPVSSGSLPPPTIILSQTPTGMSNVIPSYLRIGEPAGPPFQPIVNLSGETIIGPVVRTA